VPDLRLEGASVLRYDDTGGDRPTLLFLHAFPLGLAMWDDEARALADVARVVRFDARGFGGSTPGDGALAMDRIADDAAALLDRLGVARAIVAGCSMGGYAAFAMARRHPDRLAGLVLGDTRPGPDSPEARAGRKTLADRVLAEGARAAADAFVPKLVGPTTHAERPDVVARVREIALGNGAIGVANALLGLGAREDSTPTMAAIRVPTLVLCGEEDGVTPPAESEAMARGIAGAELAIIPRAGHLANLESPAEYQRVVRTFVRRVT
jgi:pimeloyl-ACP methyl ester carboxylesterase